MNKKYYILTLILCWAGLLCAQDGKFIASVSKNPVGTGEEFEVTFSINGNGSSFSPPDLSGFQVVGGPNVSTSMQSINGNTTVSNSFSYELVAEKEGNITIGPASIVANGRRISSNAIVVKVVKGRPQQSSGAQQATGNGAAESTANLSKQLFLRIVPDRDNVYQGQQLTITYRIYTRVAITQSLVDKMSDLTGFWNEDIKTQQQQAHWRNETYNGMLYHVADIKQTILFPEHAGNITIDPFEMTFTVREPAPAKDIMDQFFGNAFRDVNYKAKSTPLTIHVRPLPEAGKPAGFSGTVGSFSMEASVDKTHLKANEALNYKIRVTGSGNIKLLKNLNVNFPTDFEKYDPKISDTSVTESAAGVSGTRIYNYLLIPRHQGDFTIDPVTLSFFNPATGRYSSITTRSFQIKVDKGTPENSIAAFSGADKQDVKLLNKDIQYIKTGDAGVSRVGDRFYGSLMYYLLLLLGPVLCAVALIYRKWNEKNNSDIVKVKSRRASRVAAKHLANAKKQLQANNTHAFYEAVFKGLYGYLSDKLNISYADLNRETIASTLKLRSLSEGVIDRLLDTLDLCEMARYAPVTHISEQEVFEKAKDIINAIENEI